MRVKLKGLTKVKKRLADGTIQTYFYPWRGGPLLKDDDGRPLKAGDPMLHVAYTKAHAERKSGPKGTIASIITLYRESAEFTGRSEKTRADYLRYLDLIQRQFGDKPLALIEAPDARGEFKAWRDSMAATPRKADYAWSVLGRALSVAKDRGKIKVNPCERGGRLYEADRAEKVWSPAEMAKFLSVASQPLQMAMLMALWTGQRQGDLLKLTWHAYDGQFIRLKQSKTGKRVRIPVSGILKSVLDGLKATGMGNGRILRNTRGKDWTEDGFRTSWGKAYLKAGLPEDGDSLTFHDLRGTAVTRLALAGCSTSQIASFTGHSLKDVEALLDAHYLGGRFELAEQAMSLLEAHQSALQISNTVEPGKIAGDSQKNKSGTNSAN